MRSVSGAIEGDTAEIDQLLNSGAAVSKTVGDLSTQVGAIITNLDQVMTAIANRSGDLDSLVSNLQSLSRSLASHNSLARRRGREPLPGLGRPGQPAQRQPVQPQPDHHRPRRCPRRPSTRTRRTCPRVSRDSARGPPPTPRSRPGASGSRSRPSTPASPTRPACTYYEPTNPPAGSGLGGSPSGTSPLGTAPSLPMLSQAPQGTSSIPDILGAVGGSSSTTSESGQ